MATKFQKACNELNKVLSNRTENFVSIINDIIYKKVFQKGGNLYWGRELFIDCNADDELCREMLKTHPDDVMFVPTFDSDEHPGITFCYKSEKA